MQADDIPLYRLRKKQPVNSDKITWFTLVRDGFFELINQPLATLFTVLAASLSLALTLGSLVGFKNWQTLQHTWDNGSKMLLYVKTNISEDEIKNLLEHIQHRTEVEKAIYISSEQGLKELEEKNTFALAAKQITHNPLPVVIEVLPASSISSISLLEKLADSFKTLPQVDSLQFDKNYAARQIELRNFLQDAINIFIFILIFICLTLFSNSMQIHAEQKLLVLMVSGIFYGLFSGVLACLLLLLMQHNSLLYLQSFIETSSYGNAIWFKFLCGSISIGFVSALLAKLMSMTNSSAD